MASAGRTDKPVISHDGSQWLLWLQRLLKADALALYRCDGDKARLQMHPLCRLPVVDESAGASYIKLATRCALNCTVMRAASDVCADHSVVCVPDLAIHHKRTNHVLVIERRTPAKLDPQAQARLVSWAFTCLPRFSTGAVAPPASNRLTQWSLTQIDRTAPNSVVFAHLMDQVADVADCDRCLVAQLHVNNNVVTGAHVIAVSGQQRIDSRLPASESLVRAFDNVYRDKALPLVVEYQPRTDPSMAIQTSITTALEPCARLIIPVCREGHWYAVSLERSARKPFGKTEQTNLVNDLNAALALLLLSDSQIRGMKAAGKRQLHRVYSRTVACMPRTAVIASLCVAALLFLLLPAEHRVSALLSVEASERHVLIAPVDGFVESVAVKAGDSVHKGQILAVLDDLDLQLQQQKLQSDIQQNQQAYAKALATRNRVEVTRLKETASGLQAELSQLTLQRDRMVLVAPVDGVVLSGSWDDFLGAAVSSGDTLFSLGSASSHRLVLDVSEYDVKHVQPGQIIGIRMSADPSTVLQGTVTAIMPLALAKAGKNSVQVHAALNQQAQLRPGMQGVGKVLVGRQARLMRWLQRATARVVWLGWRVGVLR